MKRRSNHTADSLELLLDAICNTFGAVLFISMLVAILVSQSTQSSATVSTENNNIQMMKNQIAAKEAEETVRILQQQLQQQKELTERFASPDTIDVAAEMTEANANKARLLQDRSQAVNSATKVNAEIVQLQQKLNLQARKLQQARQQHAKISAELNQEKRQRSRVARIPQIRHTTKMARVYAIDDGRLFRVTTSTGVDENDCQKRTTAANQVEIVPIPGRGLRMTADLSADRIDQKLTDLDSGRHFVKLFVARDSFAEFLPVKDALVRQGIEYETIITENDDVRLILGTSTRPSLVQ